MLNMFMLYGWDYMQIVSNYEKEKKEKLEKEGSEYLNKINNDLCTDNHLLSPFLRT